MGMDRNLTAEEIPWQLISNEKIIWTGQPDPSVLFSRIDIFLIPFSLIWAGGAFAFQGISIFYGAPLEVILFGLPFILVGSYMLFGRFILKRQRKKKTHYAITNQRVIVYSSFINSSLQAQFIQQIPAINKTVKKNGTGTIVFGNPSLLDSMYGNTGFEFFSSFYGTSVISFYDVANVEEVYDLIHEVRNTQ